MQPMLTTRPTESPRRFAIMRWTLAPVFLAALVSGCATPPEAGVPSDLATEIDLSGAPAGAAPDSGLYQPVGLATPGSPPAVEPEATGTVGTVRPGLNLRIAVLVGGQQEFNEPSRQVSAQGSLDAPLIGKVQVAGLTLQQVEVLLTERYAQYLVQPQVVVEYVHSEGSTISPWGYVTVLGRVRNPGKLPIPATRDLTVSAAVQQAGGFDTSARTSSIRVTRQLATRTQRIDVDLKAYAKGDLDEDITLKAGDVVFVPESPW